MQECHHQRNHESFRRLLWYELLFITSLLSLLVQDYGYIIVTTLIWCKIITFLKIQMRGTWIYLTSQLLLFLNVTEIERLVMMCYRTWVLYCFIISWTAHSVPYHVDLIKLEPALVVRRAAMLRSPRTISISTQVLFSRQWLGSFWSQCRRNVCVYYYSSVSGVSCWSNATSTGKLPQNEAYPSIFDPIRSSAFFQ